MTTRRPHGSGSLRSLGDGRYRFEFRHDDGTRLSRVFTATNVTEANKQLASLRTAMIADHGERVREAEEVRDYAGVERERRQEWTVSRYADYYLEQWAAKHLAPSTYIERKRVLEKAVKPEIGHMRMADVTPTVLADLYARLEKRNAYGKEDGATLAGATIWKRHTAIRALFAYAVEVQEDFPSNPAANKKARPRVAQDGEPRRAVDVEEVEAFVELVKAEKPEIWVPVMLSAYLGTRRGETLALQRGDFDLEQAQATIRRSVTQEKTGAKTVTVRRTTKTQKVRVVPLDDHTVAILRELFREQAAARIAAGKHWRGGKTPEEDWVCGDPYGAMMEPNHFEAVFRAFVKKKGLSMTPHLLRHAFTSQLVALGYDAVTISSMTGHSPAVLLKTYAHAFDSRRKSAIAELGEARARVREAAAGK